jgi:hypothetical protein
MCVILLKAASYFGSPSFLDPSTSPPAVMA